MKHNLKKVGIFDQKIIEVAMINTEFRILDRHYETRLKIPEKTHAIHDHHLL